MSTNETAAGESGCVMLVAAVVVVVVVAMLSRADGRAGLVCVYRRSMPFQSGSSRQQVHRNPCRFWIWDLIESALTADGRLAHRVCCVSFHDPKFLCEPLLFFSTARFQ